MSPVYRHLHADGGIRWVDAWLSHGIEDPQIGGIVINLRDVTSRVESDRALQESQERYRAIVETAQERIWVTDPQRRAVYVNQKMADIAGRSTEELYSRGILKLLDVDDSTMLSRRLLERRTAGTEEYELHLRHPEGTSRCLKVCSSPLWYAEDELVGSLGMVSDSRSSNEWSELYSARLSMTTSRASRTGLCSGTAWSRRRSATRAASPTVLLWCSSTSISPSSSTTRWVTRGGPFALSAGRETEISSASRRDGGKVRR